MFSGCHNLISSSPPLMHWTVPQAVPPSGLRPAGSWSVAAVTQHLTSEQSPAPVVPVTLSHGQVPGVQCAPSGRGTPTPTLPHPVQRPHRHLLGRASQAGLTGSNHGTVSRAVPPPSMHQLPQQHPQQHITPREVIQRSSPLGRVSRWAASLSDRLWCASHQPAPGDLAP